MMQCRMCSQRLTRPGRLCRECERELERARFAAASVDDLAASVPLIDASGTFGASSERTAGVRMRAPVVVGAFAIGLGGALAIYVAQQASAPVAAGSVMLNRDLGNVRPRTFAPIARESIANASGSGGAQASAGKTASRAEPAVEGRESTAALRRVALPIQATSTADSARGPDEASPRAAAPAREPVARRTIAATTLASAERSGGLDRVLAFSDALARCAEETFFARIACEGRARAHYCDGAAAGQLPQCIGEMPRDHGQ